MKVETRDGGDGVLCWNVEAIARYAEAVTRREDELSGANPDLLVIPGRLVCYGCESLEYDLGVRCTAVLTKTLYAVEGEIRPRAEDAKGYLSDVPGMATRIDAPAAAPEVRSHTPVAPAPPPPAPPRRGLFRRTFAP